MYYLIAHKFRANSRIFFEKKLQKFAKRENLLNVDEKLKMLSRLINKFSGNSN